MSMGGSENGRNPDHDTLLQMKAMQESFIREMGQKLSQLDKDIYQMTLSIKDLRAEHRDDFCKHDKRISSIEKLVAVFESYINVLKENQIVKKQDLKDTAKDITERFEDVYEYIKQEDAETREESRRREATIGMVAGIIGAVGGSFITIIVMLWIG